MHGNPLHARAQGDFQVSSLRELDLCLTFLVQDQTGIGVMYVGEKAVG